MIVILTALELEYAAVRRHLNETEVYRHPTGTVFEIGTAPGPPAQKVVLAVAGKGNGNAATITERAITTFRPSAVLFVGIAGGLRDWLTLGDVVVATRVYGYQGWYVDDDGAAARPRGWDAPHHVEQAARHLARSEEWRAGLPAGSEPSVHFDPIAAGDVLLNSRNAPLAKQLRQHYNDAVAIEMESAGAAHAGHLNNATATLVVRAISDLADGAKAAAEDAGWQSAAARNAAAFAIALVAILDDANEIDDRPARENWPAHVHNELSGENKGFVIQVGATRGDVRVNSDRSANTR